MNQSLFHQLLSDGWQVFLQDRLQLDCAAIADIIGDTATLLR
ncbi:hypothetical protein QUB05_32970 [Microcoleus sp. F10-C6]